jgi:hypothetical protein
MKILLLIPCIVLFLFTFGQAPVRAAAGNPGSGVQDQVSALQDRMMNDEEIMKLIMALRDDPEMQAILNDPSVLKAVTEGDLDTLSRNPRFMRLLENARVKEIQRRLGN